MVVNFSTATEFCGPSILSPEPSSAQDSSVQDPKTARKEIQLVQNINVSNIPQHLDCKHVKH